MRSAKDIFLDALEVSAQERVAFVRDACGGDPGLLGEVEALLAASTDAGDFLDRGPIDAEPAGAERLLGRSIGPYRLVSVLGEGGFGTVYGAVQEDPVVRRVALKIIRPGMDSAKVAQRFEAERQALAMMDHPGIARVFDAASTPAGRPYFVMEFVDGEPITTYCETRGLSIRERVELLERVAHAIQHAHQKGILHRDLKPRNILVGTVDGEPWPKVIDFGIAKAVGRRLHATGLTEAYELIGTPEYMAPEQVSGPADDIDTRADVYSLGVLAYRVLSGRSPYEIEEGDSVGLPAWARAICESEPAPMSRGAPERVPRELEWIVAKALSKDRARRYPTAHGFAADMRRYLDGEPIEAGVPGPLHRLIKLVRRHRIVAAVVTSLLVSAAVGIAITTRSAFEISRQSYVANVFAAQAALERRDAAGARERLMRTAERLRGWEWDHLEARTRGASWTIGPDPTAGAYDIDTAGERFVVLRGGQECLELRELESGELVSRAALQRSLIGDRALSRCVRFDARDDGVVATFVDGRVVHWDLSTGALRPLESHTAAIHTVAVGPEPTTCWTADIEGELWKRDLESGAVVRRWHLEAGVHELVMSPDGGTLAIATFDQHLSLLDTHTGEVVGRCVAAAPDTPLEEPREFPDARVQCVAFTPDSSALLAGVRDGTLSYIDASDATLIWQESYHDGLIRHVDVSPDGRTGAAASHDGSASLWDLESGERRTTLEGHAGGTREVRFSRDSKTLFTAGWDHAIGLWDVESGKAIEVLTGHEAGVFSVRLGVGDERLISSGNDMTLRGWSARDALRTSLRGHRGAVRFVRFVDSNRILATDVQGWATLWDRGSRKRVRSTAVHTWPLLATTVDRDASLVVTGAGDGALRLHAFDGSEPMRPVPAHGDRVTAVALDEEIPRIASGSRDGSLRLWTRTAALTVDAEPIELEGHTAQVEALLFRGEARTLLSSSRDGTLKEWSRDGELLRTWSPAAGAPLYAMALDPEGRTLAVSTGGDEILLLDATSGAVRVRCSGHIAMITALAWLPDGSRLVSASQDRTIRLWDPKRGESVATLVGHSSAVHSLAVSPDGRTIASGSSDLSVRLWSRRAD